MQNRTSEDTHIEPISGSCWIPYDKKQPSETEKPYEVIIESTVNGNPTQTKDTIMFDKTGNWVLPKSKHTQKIVAWRRPTVM